MLHRCRLPGRALPERDLLPPQDLRRLSASVWGGAGGRLWGTLSCTCTTGLTCLANGAYAKECGGLADCPSGCPCLVAQGGKGYCSSDDTCQEPCQTDADCPAGKVCGECANPSCVDLCSAV